MVQLGSIRVAGHTFTPLLKIKTSNNSPSDTQIDRIILNVWHRCFVMASDQIHFRDLLPKKVPFYLSPAQYAFGRDGYKVVSAAQGVVPQRFECSLEARLAGQRVRVSWRAGANRKPVFQSTGFLLVES